MALHLIQSRRVLYPGSGDIRDYKDGTKVTFHFRTVKLAADGSGGDDEDQLQVIDDSRKCGKPMELIIGKKFKLILWEEWLKHMRVGEVSRLVADQRLCTDYPFVSKCYRKFSHQSNASNGSHDEEEDNIPSRRCCGMALNAGLGHQDLDELVTHPCPLQFTIELLSVESPEEYDKELWQMSESELLEAIPRYRTEGNRLYSGGQHREADQLYSKAVAIVEQLLLREKPGDEDYHRLELLKVPLLSNLCQCRLLTEDYYPVIDFAGQVLAIDPNNSKALYRKARAEGKVWNLVDSRRDYHRVLELEPSLEKTVRKELAALDVLEKERDVKDSKLLKGKLFS